MKCNSISIYVNCYFMKTFFIYIDVHKPPKEDKSGLEHVHLPSMRPKKGHFWLIPNMYTFNIHDKTKRTQATLCHYSSKTA